MSSDWPVVRLGDYCEKIGSGATPKGGSGVYLEVGEIFLIRSQNVYNDGFKEDGLVYITEDSAEKLKNVVVEENDVLLNITGDSVARVCLAKKEYLPARVNQHVAIIRPDKDEFDPRYLRYLLASPAMQNLLLTIAGAGATRNALTKGMIESLEVMKPPLIVQEAIADNLESLDDKIELNRQTNQTLEQIAQAIFKSWFVDFDPVRAKIAAREAFIQQHPEVTLDAIRAAAGTEGNTLAHAAVKACELAAICAISGKTEEQLNELDADALQQLKTTAALFPNALEKSEGGVIPAGWSEAALYDTAEYVNGGAFKASDFTSDGSGLPIIKIAELKQGIYEGTKYTNKEVNKKHYITDDDVLYSWSGSPETSLEVFKWFGGEGWLNQHIFKLNFQSEQQKYFTYYLLKHMKPVLIATAKQKQTTGLGHVTVADMKRIKAPFPDDDLLQQFKRAVAPLYEKCSICEKENISLTEARVTLLPYLLSGRHEIKGKVPA